jgi:hypothetical protein
MIENEEELIAAAYEASGLIQQITDYTREHPAHRWKGQISFPRGFLRTAIDHRRNLRFVENRRLRQNVSYALMTHDVFRWLVFHTDLSGQAQEMIIKEAVSLLGAVCEAISIFPDEHGLGRGRSFARRIVRLRELGVIDASAERRLRWLWDKRNQEHIYDVPFLEWSHYEKGDWYRSVKAYHALRDGLNDWKDTS